MHEEEGIIDATNLKDASRIQLYDRACLHRYHLFLLEMHYPSIFFPVRQGQLAASVQLCVRLLNNTPSDTINGT